MPETPDPTTVATGQTLAEAATEAAESLRDFAEAWAAASAKKAGEPDE